MGESYPMCPRERWHGCNWKWEELINYFMSFYWLDNMYGLQEAK